MKAQQNQPLEQGISGQVLWLEGNFMPTIDAGSNRKRNQGEPVAREIHIHELTNVGDVVQDGLFYSQINSKLIETVQSDEEGHFQVQLSPGRYSLFVKEEKGFFANIFDIDNNINPVEVKEDEITEITVKINYKAAY